jgi:outer membrane protein TolC
LLEIDRTRVQLESAIQTVSHAAISALLNAIMAEWQTELDELEHSVAEKVLLATRSLYEKEQVTEEAYAEARNALRSRKQETLLSSLDAEKALEILAHIIGIPVGQFRLPGLENLGLAEIADQASVFLDSPDIDKLAGLSVDVRLAFLDVKEAEIDLSAARVFAPSFSVTANTTLPNLDYSVGAQFGFSISDFDLKARDDSLRNLSYAQTFYENTLSMGRLDVRKAILELEIALEELGAARESLAESKIDLAETLYFAGQGEATELESAQSELAVRMAEYAAASAEAEAAGRWFAIQFAQF